MRRVGMRGLGVPGSWYLSSRRIEEPCIDFGVLTAHALVPPKVETARWRGAKCLIKPSWETCDS
jgi:hypothetical protein